jgi:hypothetical protein
MSEDDEVVEIDEEIDALWAREAEDRIAAFERGEVVAIPGEEVFSSLGFDLPDEDVIPEVEP